MRFYSLPDLVIINVLQKACDNVPLYNAASVDTKNWKAPLVFLAVCRRWRALALPIVHRRSIIACPPEKQPHKERGENSSLADTATVIALKTNLDIVSAKEAGRPTVLHLLVRNHKNPTILLARLIAMVRKHTALLGKIQEVCLRSDYCSLRDAAEDDNTSSADLNEAVYLGHEFSQLIPSAISFEMFYFQNPMITLFEQVLAEKYALRISMIKCDSIVLKTVSCFSDKLAHATIDASHDHVTPLPRIHSRSLKTLTLMLATQKFLWESFEDVNSPGILDFSNLRFMSLCFGHDKPAFNSVSLDSRACKASYTVLVPKLICLEIFFCPLSLSFLLALVNYSSSLQKFYIRANGPVSFLFCNFKLSSLVKSRLVQYLPNVTQNGAISDWFSHANGLLSIPDVAEVAAIDIYNDTIIDLDLAQWTYLTEIHFFRPVTLSYIVDCVANMPYLIKVKAEWISVMLEDANRTVALPSLDILSARPVQLIVNMISVKFYGNGLSENLEEQHTNYLHSQIQNLRKIRCKRFL